MKINYLKFILSLMFCLSLGKTFAQVTGSITVGGDFNKFYPTVWKDEGWNNHLASELEIGRSITHSNSEWRGAVIANFKYHTSNWGNGANFIDADIKQVNNGYQGSNIDFIAGWVDVSSSNDSRSIVVWLRGGGTSYFFKSLFAAEPKIYDGIANQLPFQVVNGPTYSYKMVKDENVNSGGLSKTGTGFLNGSGLNYFAGNVGIGTTDTKAYKLAVAGNMITESIRVNLQSAWPDYVFNKDYRIDPLAETETFINKFGHLPGVPSAKAVEANGLNLGEISIIQMKKIEELTLLLIEQGKQVTDLKKQVANLRDQVNLLKE